MKYRILLAPDPVAGNSVAETPAQTIARLTAENKALQEQVAAAQAADAQRVEDEKAIAEKTSKGLTRDQAIAVIKRQKDHDAAIAQLWEKRRPGIVAILKEGLSERETRAAIRELDGSITLDEIVAARATLKK